MRRWADSSCPGTLPPPLASRWWRQSFRLIIEHWTAEVHDEELARRYPRLRLAGDQEFTFHPNISFRRPQVLRVRSAEADGAGHRR